MPHRHPSGKRNKKSRRGRLEMQRLTGTGSSEAKQTADRGITGGAAVEHPLPVLNGALPASCGETRIILLPIDPYLVHAYWDVSDQDRAYVGALVREGSLLPRALLRFHDVTALPVGGVRAAGSFDVEIELGSRNWYIHLLSPEKAYIVDLGFRGAEGRFHRIARSNRVETPRAWPCGEAGQQSMHVTEVDGVLCADLVAGTRPSDDPGLPPSARETLHPVDVAGQEIPPRTGSADAEPSAAGAGGAAERGPARGPGTLPEARSQEQPWTGHGARKQAPARPVESRPARHSPLPPFRSLRGAGIPRASVEAASGRGQEPRPAGGEVRLERPRTAGSPPGRTGVDLSAHCEQGFLFGLSSGRIAAAHAGEEEDEG
jgi:hypothetical protein